MDIREMNAKKVYDCLIAKAEKKGRERFEVDKVTSWLTGYKISVLTDDSLSGMTYGEFIEKAPKLNPNRALDKINDVDEAIKAGAKVILDNCAADYVAIWYSDRNLVGQ